MDSKKEKEKENETKTPSSFSTRFIGLTASAKLQELCKKCSDQPVLLKELKELAVILVDNDQNDPMVGAHKWVMSSQTWLLLKDSKDSQTIYDSMIKDFPKKRFV